MISVRHNPDKYIVFCDTIKCHLCINSSRLPRSSSPFKMWVCLYWSEFRDLHPGGLHNVCSLNICGAIAFMLRFTPTYVAAILTYCVSCLCGGSKMSPRTSCGCIFLVLRNHGLYVVYMLMR